MKDIVTKIYEGYSKLNIPTWDDIVDMTGSSDNTLTKGRFIIGYGNEKFKDVDNKDNYFERVFTKDMYEEFVDAYKDAGGTIEETKGGQGLYEVFCEYNGKGKAAQYILLSFWRIIYQRLQLKV